jgi:hypothetical protein
MYQYVRKKFACAGDEISTKFVLSSLSAGGYDSGEIFIVLCSSYLIIALTCLPRCMCLSPVSRISRESCRIHASVPCDCAVCRCSAFTHSASDVLMLRRDVPTQLGKCKVDLPCASIQVPASAGSTQVITLRDSDSLGFNHIARPRSE